MKSVKKFKLALVLALLALLLLVPAALADHPDEGLGEPDHSMFDEGSRDPSAALSAHDAAVEGIVSSGPSAKVIKNVAPSGRGERAVPNATTDVWTLGDYAYTGTFNDPCGGDPEAGVWIWDVHNHNKASFVGIIPSPEGSRSNDVRVASMNSGDVLVHSNEACAAGGRGGFEVYNVDDPSNPVLLASVQTDDVNIFIRDNFGFTDFGVHNLFLFSQGENDYVAATVESLLGNFQIYDITDPTAPTLVGWWGAEEIGFPGEDFRNTTDLGLIIAAQDYLNDGFGASSNRFLHDATINAEGTRAYLANWDAGLVLLDITDVTNPLVVSIAIDPENGSLDGEVNSHSVWPSEDGTIVVEGEEDFSVFEGDTPFLGSLQFLNTIPGVGTSTNTGNALEASPPGNVGTLTATTLTVENGPLAGNTYEVLDMVNNNFPLGAGSVSGNLVWIGRACNGDTLDNTISSGDIAIARRGDCFFSDKAENAAAAGAAAIVIANNQEDSVWSGLRVWDYSDETNPVLKSTFDTVCSADPGDAICDRAGTYSVHNVIVETTGNKTKAYVSWYSDGMLVLDVSDPANPVEVGRYTEPGTDFWGVYKVENAPWIYGSDRNGGLYIFKEFGSGSEGKK